jgi:hypothetical protein
MSKAVATDPPTTIAQSTGFMATGTSASAVNVWFVVWRNLANVVASSTSAHLPTKHGASGNAK